MLFAENILSSDAKSNGDALDTIAETDNEDFGEEELSETALGRSTDETATEDETVDHTQGSDEEG